MSTPLILPLDTEHASLEAAGGKGMNLACTVEAHCIQIAALKKH
jgi:hypothetical protein